MTPFRDTKSYIKLPNVLQASITFHQILVLAYIMSTKVDFNHPV